jgi:hypothetical protein
MRDEITVHKVSGITILKLRGGRGTLVYREDKRYSRKIKHKGLDK